MSDTMSISSPLSNDTGLIQSGLNTPISNTPISATEPGKLHVIRRNGKITPFDGDKIAIAMTKAFLAVEGGHAAASVRIHETVERLTQIISATFKRRLPAGGMVHIEDIQDQVELTLMREGLQKVAREYVLYREERKRLRLANNEAQTNLEIKVTLPHGERVPLSSLQLDRLIRDACKNLAEIDPALILTETHRNLFDGVALADVNKAAIMSARTLIEKEPNYSYACARLLLIDLYQEALRFLGIPQQQVYFSEMPNYYANTLSDYIERGISLELLDPQLRSFDLPRLSQAICAERDFQFTYLGLQTLYDRYFIHHKDVRFEMPQIFFMRVAMGLSIAEPDKNARAIEFYHLLSSFDYMSSTPTLFNSGTLRAQLSSCYLTTIPDDLSGIYNAMRDNALLSKYAGGLGNDWTPVRAMHAHIKGTNGKSQGVVPFMKVANDTAVAVNQGGKRKGAVCAYLETWHMDIEEFLELRKNTGDERRRTHDMNTANWIPDLFMKRVMTDQPWTLFSPDETVDLHELYGSAFEKRYVQYEAQAEAGHLVHKKVPAVKLWRKMLGMLFETGHPWITFKDPCNLRSPQQHVGVIHSSNLCTEITLNTSEEEIAVCNLGSINLAQHLTPGGHLDHPKLQKTIRTAMRMLDNVIDINFYSVPQARKSNLRHRPVGLGMMGFQDALHILRIPYATDAAVQFADTTMEAISYYAIEASTNLAQERGAYESFQGSLWSRGILPLDSIQLLKETRGDYLDQDTQSTLDWNKLRQRVTTVGMRNSNTMAIAPTATISNICGVAQSIEPTFQNLFVKSNLSGEFTVINPYLVRDLKARQLWDDVMVNDLKYFNGGIQKIDRIPDDLKLLYATAFEIDPQWLILAASRRQKWIDQAQSLNLYMAQPSGKKMDDLYKLAWRLGLKTTYYLRSLGATDTEKSTVAQGVLNAVQNNTVSEPKACLITDPECEACQ